MTGTSSNSIGSPELPEAAPSSWQMLLALCGAGAVLGILSIPPLLSKAAASLSSLDPSWQESLGVALLDHLQFGSQYLWTYGPLGFLHDSFTYPSVALTDFAAAANVVAHIVYVVAFLLFADFLRRTKRVGRVEGSILLIASGLAAYWSSTAFDVGDILVMWSLLSTAICLYHPNSRRVPYLAGLIGSLLALASLYKASFLWAAILQLLLLALVFRLSKPSLQRGIAPAWVAFTALFVVLWIATGQHLANIGSFIIGSWQLSIGYSSNMSVGIDWKLSVALGLLGILGLLTPLVSIRWKQPLSPQTSIVLLILPFLYVTWSDAVVRMEGGGLADPKATGLFLTLVAIGCLVALMGPRLLSWSAVAPGVVAALCAVIMVGELGPLLGQPWILTTIAASNAPNAAVPWYETIPPKDISLLRGYTVDAVPWDVDLVIDHHLKWDPLPVPQTYAAYTSYLDHLEALQSNSSHGAERVVASFTEIDSRYEIWDPPLLWQSLLERYSCEASTGISAILRRGSAMPGPVHHIDRVETTFGKWLSVPITKYRFELASIDVPSSWEGAAIGIALRQAAVMVQFRLSNGRTLRPFRFQATDALDGEYISKYIKGPRALCDVMSDRANAVPSIVSMRFLTHHTSQWSHEISVTFMGRT